MNKQLYNMLKTSALADKSKALLTLELLGKHPAGVGEHSTKDFYENAEEALDKLHDAEARLETLEKHYGDDTCCDHQDCKG